MGDQASSSFDARLRDLTSALGEAIELLYRYDAQNWAEYLQGCLRGLDTYDGNALDTLLRAYGGMGSFNDLVLGLPVGSEGFPDDLRVANDRLEDLRRRCYSLAQDLRQELRRP